LSSYECLRGEIISNRGITSLIQLEYSGFEGATVPICTFCVNKSNLPDYIGNYIRLSDFKGAINQSIKTIEAIKNPDSTWHYKTKQSEFKKIPGSPIAYWASKNFRLAFDNGTAFGEVAKARKGLSTGNNDLFIRLWQEVSIEKCLLGETEKKNDKIAATKWFPLAKGGD
ncbi:BREX-1 system adenine-specific DNA-methyltransferase PglX, partial [Salmonella enterica subsp. enterica serovar Jukestown]